VLIGLKRSLAAALVLALAGCGGGSELERLAAGERGRVVEVRSGDVVVLASGLVVRLVGLETPRQGDPGAAAARDDLARMVDGRAVELYYGGVRRDAYGRALAQVRRTDDRRWVQCALLRDGVAEVRTFADNRAVARPMLACEAEARKNRRGLWAAAASPVRVPSEVDGRAAGFTIVEGRIARATATSSGVYLDFQEEKGGFAAQIARRFVSVFDEAGTAPQSLAGHLVRVRGVIGGDGLMRLDHPEQVEMLRNR
jgi:endonuclease YncB( thermonuclease family)